MRLTKILLTLIIAFSLKASAMAKSDEGERTHCCCFGDKTSSQEKAPLKASQDEEDDDEGDHFPRCAMCLWFCEMNCLQCLKCFTCGLVNDRNW